MLPTAPGPPVSGSLQTAQLARVFSASSRRYSARAEVSSASPMARIATAEERAQLWPGIAAAHPGYASYQDKTDREIPLVLLEEPAD